MHGGAQGSGAPRGNKNALKTGFYTRRAKAERKNILTLLRHSLRHSRDLMQKAKRAANPSS
jgi:uncharacterized protein YjcR